MICHTNYTNYYLVFIVTELNSPQKTKKEDSRPWVGNLFSQNTEPNKRSKCLRAQVLGASLRDSREAMELQECLKELNNQVKYSVY